MSRYIFCSRCHGDLFNDLGTKEFAEVEFQILECTNCGNYVNLEIKGKTYQKNSVKINTKNGQKLLKKT